MLFSLFIQNPFQNIFVYPPAGTLLYHICHLRCQRASEDLRGFSRQPQRARNPGNDSSGTSEFLRQGRGRCTGNKGAAGWLDLQVTQTGRDKWICVTWKLSVSWRIIIIIEGICTVPIWCTRWEPREVHHYTELSLTLMYACLHTYTHTHT